MANIPVAPLPPYRALTAGWNGCWAADQNDRTELLTRGQALRLVADSPVIIINAPLIANRLGAPEISGLDLLELFAFTRPTEFCVPNARGLAQALGLPPPDQPEDEPPLLRAAARALLAEIADPAWRYRAGAYGAAQALSRLRWPWAALVVGGIAAPEKAERPLFSALPEWESPTPRAPPRTVDMEEGEVLALLDRLVGHDAEARGGQRDYAAGVIHAFRPRSRVDSPNIVLAEAGTGTGKTLGYLAPAALWAHGSDGAVWVSTFTKALQRQLDQELSKVYRDPATKAARTVVRKGRENYLCLLNLEDAVQGAFLGRAAVFAHLVARWARYTRDGDMIGGDFPGWLASLFGASRASALTDRRGECVYAGCPHFRRCFIERAIVRTSGADIVVANHALVMVNAARGRSEGAGLQRLVFDEGHHLFDAADATFAIRLSGQETLELRRWLLGPEASRARGRRRGLEARLAELTLCDEAAKAALIQCLAAARDLPAEGWLARVAEHTPAGPLEQLLAAVRAQVYARADSSETGYGLETDLSQPDSRLLDAATAAACALEALMRPILALSARLEALFEEQPDWLDTAARSRLEGARSGLEWRRQMLAAWGALLARIGGPVDTEFIDWLSVERVEARETDIAVNRHWLDPTRPFARTVLEAAHGAVITSATLRDPPAAHAADAGWGDAAARVGVPHIAARVSHLSTGSPFNYAEAARLFIVTDVKRGDTAELAGAYRRLIEAAGGGALGLFTAIARLKAVHARIAEPLARAGLPLLAQHVDPIDTGTLVDLFRAEPHASLLGTDALRDGVDVPGEALRLVVLEGVPWPRPTLVHAARKAAFGGAAWEDRMTRARLAQAFGRLIRRAGDRGVFVLLGAATPSRLLDAFPPGVQPRRLPLAEAIEATQAFLAASNSTGQAVDVNRR